MPLSSSAHCTFSPHILSPDYSLFRHCIISQALQPLLPPFHLQQHSPTELGSLASKFHPFLSSGAQPAASSSYFSITQESYGSWSSDVATPPVSSKGKMGFSASSSELEEDAGSSIAKEGDARSSEQPSEVGRARSKNRSELTDASGAKDTINVSIIQVEEEENSFENESSEPGDFKRLPINLDLELYRAKCLFRKREFNEAEKILRQCIKDWPTDGRAYVSLGSRLVKLGRFVEARKIYEDGCQAARGENPYIWQAWAVLEQRLGHISQARKLYDASTAADIKHVAAWHGWAVLELQQGSTRKARELLSKGLKFCGSNEYLYQTSALIEYRAGKIEEARVLFSQAVSCNPNSCASWLAWALLEAENGNASTAQYLFQRCIRASPKNRYAWQAWALFECGQGNKPWARRLFEQGIELNPYDAILLQTFALFEYESANPERARELFKQAASKDPKHQPVWNAWGWMEWKEKNFDLGRQYYRKSLSINSRSAEAARIYHAWALLEEEAENYAAARELFKLALRVDPQNIPSWQSWARMEENIGNGERAEEIRTQYLQQRTEVVDEAPWDLSFSSMFAPAINRIKDFFKIETPPMTEEENTAGIMPEFVEVLNRRKLDMDKVKCDEDFDLEAFIKEVLPWKYRAGSNNTSKEKLEPSLQVTTVSS